MQFDYDSIPTGYYDEIYLRRHGVQSAWHHLKFHHINSRIPPRSKQLLDIGCGAGSFIGSLPDKFECMGVDISEKQIHYAATHYGGPHRKFRRIEPMTKLPFEDATFDSVTIVELIEHLEWDEVVHVLVEARRIVRPDGIVLATTPNYFSLWPLLEKAVNRLGDVSYENQHITLFTSRRLKRAFHEAGFRQARVTSFQGIGPFAATLSWKLAHAISKLENPLLSWGAGFLLLGEAKPNGKEC